MGAKFCLVVNPAAGRGRGARLLSEVLGPLATAGAQTRVEESSSLDHARQGPAQRCACSCPTPRPREHAQARLGGSRPVERVRTATYRRNAARAAAAVELKYSGGSMKPHSLNTEPLVTARR
jgi:hypothetical protein